MLVSLGLLLVVIGALLAVAGALLSAFGGRGWRLPGDMTIARPGFTLSFPLVTSLLLSAVLTLVLWVVAALRR